jgi:HPt (histidine-containing phosphotransfer) domain-containing protein
MGLGAYGSVAFDRPGGETCGSAHSRPIDLTHLSRQTLGDRALEQEVLQLFVQQALMVRDEISGAAPVERLRIAHGLKGSARSVGAFAVAKCVEAIEKDPSDGRALKQLSDRIDEVRDFIAAIGR